MDRWRFDERRYDRRDSDADFDAHSTGYRKNVVNCAHESFTPKNLEVSSKVQKSGMGGQLEMVGESANGLQSREMVFERRRKVAGFDGIDGFDGVERRRWRHKAALT